MSLDSLQVVPDIVENTTKQPSFERVSIPLPNITPKNGVSWTYDEIAYRHGGGLVAIEVSNENDISFQVDVAEAKVFFLIGGPGSGKSTVAVNLAADLGIIHLVPELIIRRLEQMGPQAVWEAVKCAMDEHGNVPDDLIILLLKMEIEKHMEHGEDTFVVEGFPHSYGQFETSDKTFNFQIAIGLQVSSDTMEKRYLQNPMTFDEGTVRLEKLRKQRATYHTEITTLVSHRNFTTSLVTIIAEKEFDVFYPYIKSIVEARLASSLLKGIVNVCPAANDENDG